MHIAGGTGLFIGANYEGATNLTAIIVFTSIFAGSIAARPLSMLMVRFEPHRILVVLARWICPWG
jgi:hypothetical protein